jgi:hypothetical protein
MCDRTWDNLALRHLLACRVEVGRPPLTSCSGKADIASALKGRRYVSDMRLWFDTSKRERDGGG